MDTKKIYTLIFEAFKKVIQDNQEQIIKIISEKIENEKSSETIIQNKKYKIKKNKNIVVYFLGDNKYDYSAMKEMLEDFKSDLDIGNIIFSEEKMKILTKNFLCNLENNELPFCIIAEIKDEKIISTDIFTNFGSHCVLNCTELVVNNYDFEIPCEYLLDYICLNYFGSAKESLEKIDVRAHNEFDAHNFAFHIVAHIKYEVKKQIVVLEKARKEMDYEIGRLRDQKDEIEENIDKKQDSILEIIEKIEILNHKIKKMNN
jgi:hypothetical protein